MGIKARIWQLRRNTLLYEMEQFEERLSKAQDPLEMLPLMPEMERLQERARKMCAVYDDMLYKGQIAKEKIEQSVKNGDESSKVLESILNHPTLCKLLSMDSETQEYLRGLYDNNNHQNEPKLDDKEIPTPITIEECDG